MLRIPETKHVSNEEALKKNGRAGRPFYLKSERDISRTDFEERLLNFITHMTY